MLEQIKNNNSLINGDKFFVFFDIDSHFKDLDDYRKTINNYKNETIQPIVCNSSFELILILHYIEYRDLDFEKLEYTCSNKDLDSYLKILIGENDINFKKQMKNNNR